MPSRRCRVRGCSMSGSRSLMPAACPTREGAFPEDCGPTANAWTEWYPSTQRRTRSFSQRLRWMDLGLGSAFAGPSAGSRRENPRPRHQGGDLRHRRNDSESWGSFRLRCRADGLADTGGELLARLGGTLQGAAGIGADNPNGSRFGIGEAGINKHDRCEADTSKPPLSVRTTPARRSTLTFLRKLLGSRANPERGF
jgi:hypothetical protein